MPPDKLKKLQELLKLVDEGMTKAEFVAFSKELLKQVIAIEGKILERSDKRTSQEIQDLKDLKEQFQEIINQAKKDSTSTFGQIKQRAMEVVEDFILKSNLNQRVKDTLDRVEMAIEHANKVEDGHTPTPEEMKPVAMEAMKEMMPDMMKEHEITPFDVRDKLESIKVEDDKLIIEAIKGLREELDELKKLRGAMRMGGGGTSDMGVQFSLGRIVKKETPVGAINGVNLAYTVSSEIHAVLSFAINGEAITDDLYATSGNTITFTTAIDASLSGTSFRIVFV